MATDEWTLREIAEHYGVSKQAVEQWAGRDDFPAPRRIGHMRVWSRAEVIAWHRARRMRKDGRKGRAVQAFRNTGNISEAARRAGVSRNTARAWLIALGELPKEGLHGRG